MVEIKIKLTLATHASRPNPDDTFEYDTTINGKPIGSATPKVSRKDHKPPNAQLVWTCTITDDKKRYDCNSFAVHFKGLSPCPAVRGRSGQAGTVQMTLNHDTKVVGRFPYFVAVTDDEGRVWTDDPDMIVFA